jgi:hypothetical protein
MWDLSWGQKMALDNLIGISLEKIQSDPNAIKRLLHAAERNIVDSKNDGITEQAKQKKGRKQIFLF